MNTIDTETGLDSEYTLKSFIQDDSNHLAAAAALAVAEQPGEAYNPLFIYGDPGIGASHFFRPRGGPGIGKTHLLHAIGNYARNLRPELRVRYITGEQLFSAYIDAIGSGRGMPNFRNRFRDIDMLLIDGIESLQDKPDIGELLCQILDALTSTARQVVITSNLLPRHLGDFTAELESRLSSSLIGTIGLPSYELRKKIVAQTMGEIGLQTNPKVLKYIARNYATDIRQLKGAVYQVVAFVSFTSKPVTLKGARAALIDTLPQYGEPLLLEVTPYEGKRLYLKYDNGEERIYDVLPSIQYHHLFRHLADDEEFQKVEVLFGNSVCWGGAEGTSIAPEYLYDKSIEIKKEEITMDEGIVMHEVLVEMELQSFREKGEVYFDLFMDGEWLLTFDMAGNKTAGEIDGLLLDAFREDLMENMGTLQIMLAQEEEEQNSESR